MRAKSEISADGRTLVIVLFERQGVEAETPVVRATFEIHTPQNVSIQHLRIAVPLSVVRMDTCEPVDLSDDEYTDVMEVVAEELNTDKDW